MTSRTAVSGTASGLGLEHGASRAANSPTLRALLAGGTLRICCGARHFSAHQFPWGCIRCRCCARGLRFLPASSLLLRRGSGPRSADSGSSSWISLSATRRHTQCLHAIWGCPGRGPDTVRISLGAVGRAQQLHSVALVTPSGSVNRVLYRRSGIDEFYSNGPYGVEQSFTVLKSPARGAGPLVLALHVGGSLVPAQIGSAAVFRRRNGATLLRYTDLRAEDATGRRLPAQMKIRRGAIQLVVDDRHASYPVRIDPLVQRGSKLSATCEGGTCLFGDRVALSSDGNTALIGAPIENSFTGSAWVFTRSGSTWTQQGGKLTGGEETGAGLFGARVALSSTGDTALIGGEGDHGEVGAVWAFTRSGAAWTQQGKKITANGEVGAGTFGSSVALSSDGNTAW